MSELEYFEGLKDEITNFIGMLEANGLELNEDGDIVEKSSKKLLWDIIHGNDENEE